MAEVEGGPRQFSTEEWDRVAPGQAVRLATDSPLHRGEYESRVLEVSDGRLRVAVPLEEGRVVLIPVGTRLRLEVATPEGPLRFDSRIIDRVGGDERCLVVERPSRARPRAGPACRVVTVSSGKGGVGKTTLVVNLGMALRDLGQRVCVVDGDLGTADVDVLLNLAPRYDLSHVLRGERGIFEVVVEGPGGIAILPGGSGLQELTTLDERQFGKLRKEFRLLEAYADLMLVDTGSGVAPSVTNFIRAADEGIIVAAPEPHAITDAYALIKVLAQLGTETRLHLVVNRVRDGAEAADIMRKMSFASRRFLGVELNPLGFVAEDPAVGRSVREQRDFVSAYPRSRAAVSLRAVAQALLTGKESLAPPGLSLLERMRDMVGLRGARGG